MIRKKGQHDDYVMIQKLKKSLLLMWKWTIYITMNANKEEIKS